ncbi:MAG TPA: Sec-independent protein translocase TatB [Candidatus Yaniella excrementavium]|nr:Sec-independent protein translocase TatB [Candidatus Yaniella excrementavium]
MNIFGINGGELIVLIVLALMLLGPEKIPQYLRTLREWIHKARVFAEGAKDQFKEETGTDFDEVDWQKYDPRQYDPRRVIREALSEPIEDIEASMKDAKNTVQDAADTVSQKPVERPALSQAEIMAAAVPIDQLEQQSQFPDPSQPKSSADAALPDAREADQPVLENPVDLVAAEEAAAQTNVESEVPAALGTPFDAEAT